MGYVGKLALSAKRVSVVTAMDVKAAKVSLVELPVTIAVLLCGAVAAVYSL